MMIDLVDKVIRTTLWITVMAAFAAAAYWGLPGVWHSHSPRGGPVGALVLGIGCLFAILIIGQQIVSIYSQPGGRRNKET